MVTADLELDRQNQTWVIVGWLKMDFTPKVTAHKILSYFILKSNMAKKIID